MLKHFKCIDLALLVCYYYHKVKIGICVTLFGRFRTRFAIAYKVKIWKGDGVNGEYDSGKGR